MGTFRKKYGWIFATILGSVVFAMGFGLFLAPNDINNGGVSGLAQIAVHVFEIGTVGCFSVCFNIPLFLIGGLRIGKQFFAGSAIGLLVSSVMIDVFSGIPFAPQETLLGAIYGGVFCGLGLGIVFSCGTSTGGSDIFVRLLKLRYRNVPIGAISLCFDLSVVVLTGIVFGDISRTLYSGITVTICSMVMDLVIYRFDYSRVAIVITDKPDEIARLIGIKLDRGSTFLSGEGTFTHQQKKVVLTVVKKRQLAELKELIMEADERAFVIVQEAHQVLGHGFSRYSRDAL